MQSNPRSIYYGQVFPAQEVITYLRGDDPANYMELSLTITEEGIKKRRQGEEHPKTYWKRYLDVSTLATIAGFTGIERIDVGQEDAEPIRKHPPFLVLNRTRREAYRRRLVFDFDLEKERPECCKKESKLCQRCWHSELLPVLASSRRFFLKTLGPEWQPVPFFSGRRGLHFWFPGKIWLSELPASSRLLLLQQLEKEVGVTFDQASSTQLDHLIRCPWSVHEVTGAIVRPITEEANFEDHLGASSVDVLLSSDEKGDGGQFHKMGALQEKVDKLSREIRDEIRGTLQIA